MLIRMPEDVPWAMTQHKERGMKVHIWIGKSRIAGKGLFAGQDINKETIITRYRGTKISKAQSAHALAQGNAYICSLNDRYDIDGNTLKIPPAISIIPASPTVPCRPRPGLFGSSLYAIFRQGKN